MLTDTQFQIATEGYGAMKKIENIKILFVAGFGPIVDKGKASEKFYRDTFGIPFKQEVRTFGIPPKGEEGGYLYTEEMEGVKHFALWPLSLVAQACFDKDSWPDDIRVPQAWIDFDVEDLERATAELKSLGYRLLVAGKKEPWGQTVTRLISPEGLLVAITATPWLRNKQSRSGEGKH